MENLEVISNYKGELIIGTLYRENKYSKTQYADHTVIEPKANLSNVQIKYLQNNDFIFDKDHNNFTKTKLSIKGNNADTISRNFYNGDICVSYFQTQMEKIESELKNCGIIG